MYMCIIWVKECFETQWFDITACKGHKRFLPPKSPIDSQSFFAKNSFWTFWRFSGWKWAKLASVYSNRHLQHDSMPFFPLVLHFTTFLLNPGFSNWRKVAGGNCKVAGALSRHDYGSLVEWEKHPRSLERNGELPLENFENQGALIKWSLFPCIFCTPYWFCWTPLYSY